MAIKVLKEGRDLTVGELKIVLCPKCGCEFSYTEMDVTTFKAVGGGLQQRLIRCPNTTCLETIILGNSCNIETING